MASEVWIVGLGGVGSFAAEALARSGVGHLRLVDFDVVGLSDSNRQLPALEGNYGRPKAEVMRERLSAIHPEAKIEGSQLRYSAETSDAFFDRRPDALIDAIDLVTHKCQLLADCRRLKIPVVSSLGAAGRSDPTQIEVTDLNRSHHDRLGAAVRKVLKQRHGFPRNPKWGIPAVFSQESPKPPLLQGPASGDRARTGGTLVSVTGTFGFVAASVVIRGLLGWD